MCHVKITNVVKGGEWNNLFDYTYRRRRYNQTQKSDNNKQQKKQQQTKQKNKEDKQKKAADLHVSLLLAGCLSSIQDNTEPGA